MNPVLNDDNYVPDDIQERDVVLGDGKTHTLTFKRISGAEYYAYAQAQRFGTDDQKARAIARLVAVSLVDNAGERVLTEERAAVLKPPVLVALLAAANDVNGEGDEKKPSAPEVTDTSGT